jgi:hypothetical protein
MCINCDEIIQVGNSGTDGWSPILALYEGECDGDPVTVHQLVSWVDGTGTRPDYDGDIMTDAWLAANPIYLGSTGLVTDICEATNLQPANGATGATGPQGPAGPAGEAGNDGCDPVISILASVVGGDKTYEVDVIGPGESPCFPIYELEFPIEMITDNSELTTAIDTAVQEALSPDVVSYTYLSGDIGSKIFCISEVGSVTAALNTSTYNNMSYVQYKILGNTMFLNFRLYLDISSVSFPASYYLEILIPNSKTYASNSMSNIAYNLNATTVSFDIIPVISANSSSSSKLKIGFYLNNGNVGYLYGFDGTTQTFNGSLTFSIN